MSCLWNRWDIYSYRILIVYSFFHCVQDGGPLPSSLMTRVQSKSPELTMSCSAGGGKGVKEPQDLNYMTFRYFLDTESALRDTMIDSSLQGLGPFRYIWSRVPWSYLLCCVFAQFYLQSSNSLPHRLDSVWYSFLIYSLLPFQACSYSWCSLLQFKFVAHCLCLHLLFRAWLLSLMTPRRLLLFHKVSSFWD